MQKIISARSAAIGFLLLSAASHADPFVVHPDARGVQSADVSLDSYSWMEGWLEVR